MGELLTSLEQKCQFHQSINSFVVTFINKCEAYQEKEIKFKNNRSCFDDFEVTSDTTRGEGKNYICL